MRPLTFALALVTLVFSVPALSQECNPADESQLGMNICADAEYRAEDAKLNKAYHEVMKLLSGDAADKKLLQAAQRAWIAFRDAECAFSTSDSEGGSIHPMMVSQCLTELTRARTAQLNGYLNCEEGDLSCRAAQAQ